jgi:hypothetical protein
MTSNNHAATFSYSSSMKGLFLFGLIFFGCGLIGSIIMLFVIPKMWWVWIPTIIGYYYFTNICLTAWRTRDNFIKVNGEGIALHAKASQIEFVNWKDIVDVKIHKFCKRLTLRDKHDKSIKLEYELDKFSDLLDTIIDNIPQLNAVSISLRKLSASLKR